MSYGGTGGRSRTVTVGLPPPSATIDFAPTGARDGQARTRGRIAVGIIASMSITGGDFVELGRDLYAWLPPKRGWGLANCGLLTSPRGAIWIDTPYDPVLIGQFLAES